MWGEGSAAAPQGLLPRQGRKPVPSPIPPPRDLGVSRGSAREAESSATREVSCPLTYPSSVSQGLRVGVGASGHDTFGFLIDGTGCP